LIDQVLLEANVAREKVNNESLSEGRALMQDLGHHRLLDPQQGDIRDGRGARDPTRLAGETSLPKEVTDPEQADDRRFPAMRHHRQLDAARLNEEHRIGGGSLREDALAFAALHEGSPRADLREEHLHVKTGRALSCHDTSLQRVFEPGSPNSV
jgi:hypothetical protein